MPTLSIDKPDVRYGQIQATRGLSFSVGTGEIVTLAGGLAHPRKTNDHEPRHLLCGDVPWI